MDLKSILFLLLAMAAGGSIVLIVQDLQFKFLIDNTEGLDDDSIYDVYEIGQKQYILPVTIINGIETLSLALNILAKQLEKNQHKNVKNKKTFEEFMQQSIIGAKKIIKEKADEDQLL